MPEKTVELERQTPVHTVCGLSAALVRALGELGFGGPEAATILTETVEAECVTCAIKVSGADLTSAGLSSNAAPPGLSEKLARLQLGYCCRKDCTSRYYLIRFARHPRVDWREVWSRVEPRLGAVEDPVSGGARSARVRWRDLIPVEWVERAKHPMTLCVISVVAVALFILGGCRVPGLSPKPRVFIVTSTAPWSVEGGVTRP